MRVRVDGGGARPGEPPLWYAALRAEKEPCVLLYLIAHGSHPETTGQKLDEALLLPVSLFETLAARIEGLEAAVESLSRRCDHLEGIVD